MELICILKFAETIFLAYENTDPHMMHAIELIHVYSPILNPKKFIFLPSTCFKSNNYISDFTAWQAHVHCHEWYVYHEKLVQKANRPLSRYSCSTKC